MGLGQELTARCSEDQLSPLPHGRSQCGRKLSGRCGHGADPLLHGGWWGVPAQAPRSTTRQHLKGTKPPAPQSHPWEFVPQLHLHLVSHEGCSRDPGHIHTTVTLSQRHTCRRRTAKTHCSVAEAKSRWTARSHRRRQTDSRIFIIPRTPD